MNRYSIKIIKDDELIYYFTDCYNIEFYNDTIHFDIQYKDKPKYTVMIASDINDMIIDIKFINNYELEK